MLCPKCGAENEDTSNVCKNCGQRLLPSTTPVRDRRLRTLMLVLTVALVLSVGVLVASLILLRLEEAGPPLATTPSSARAEATTTLRPTHTSFPTPSPLPTSTPTPPALPVKVEASQVELVGHLGGATRAVAVQGNYAYIGEGPRLTVLDVSEPASPSMAGKTIPLPGVVEDVAVTENTAYVAAGQAGLRVVDISNPTNPTEVGDCDLFGTARDVTVGGGYAYVAVGESGLCVVDISQPSTPKMVGQYDSFGLVHGVAVVGQYVYAAGPRGLLVIDVSDPAIPMEISFFEISGTGWDVAIVGNYAYLAGEFSGLHVIDISTPAEPVEIGIASDIGEAWAVSVADVTAYAIDRMGRHLWIVDVSDPAHPNAIGTYTAPGGGMMEMSGDVVVAGNTAYVAADTAGLRVVDVSEPTHPKEIGAYDTPEGVDIAIASEIAHIRDGYLGVWTVDVSDPSNPRDMELSQVAGDTVSPRGSTVMGRYTYVAARYDGLLVMDASDSSGSTEVGRCDTPGDALGIAVAGNYAYIADAPVREDSGYVSGGLRVVDVSDPTNPIEVGFCDTPGEPWAVAVVGDPSAGSGQAYAYVADGEVGGVRVVDVSTPSEPREVGFFDTWGMAMGIAVAGDYLCVADADGGILILRHTQEAAVASDSSLSPTPSPTPYEGGAVVHIVQEGDSLFGIALMYSVEVDQIRRLNDLAPSDLLHVGQELVISLPSPTSDATSTPPAGILSHPWPMYRHDARRSGCTTRAGPDTPTLRWAFEGQGNISAPVIAADGTLYIDAGKGDLRALDPAGREKWAYALPAASLARLALAEDGTLYAAQGSELYALQPDGLALKWTYSADTSIYDLVIVPNGTIYVASNAIHAVDPVDGVRRWVTDNDDCNGFAALAVAPGGVYGMTTLEVCAFTHGGQFKWKEMTAPGARGFNTAITLGLQESIYVNSGGAAGARIALPISPLGILNLDGSIREFLFDDYFASPPAVTQDGVLYMGWREVGEEVETEDGRITAELGPLQLQARFPTATVTWSYPLGENMCSYPVVGGDGTIYVVLRNGNLCALDRNGNLKWTFNVGESSETGQWTAWDLAIGDGTIYVASDSRLYAIEETE